MTDWCPECHTHLVDPKGHRPQCPVCADRQTKDAEARVAAMIHRLTHQEDTG
jgi:uncharacterized Zn finger protein (UPF0148 family)